MSLMDVARARLTRIQMVAMGIGLLGTIALAIGATFDTPQALRSYLYAYLFWLGVTLGSMAIVMIHHLTGGAWGFVIRRLGEAAALTAPLMALLIVPILVGMPDLYVWSHHSVIAADATLRQKSSFFLSVPWFIGRAGLYFAIWITLAWILRKWSLEQDRTGNVVIEQNFQALCAGGLVIYVLSMSYAALDWYMTIEPHWFSTIFAMIVLVGQGLSGIALLIVAATMAIGPERLKELASIKALQDLGHLLLAFVVLWTYCSFSQYIIIWSGNISAESIWYIHRGRGGWRPVIFTIVFGHFLIPLWLLVWGNLKRNPVSLSLIAGFILLAHVLEQFWLVMPAYHNSISQISWMSLASPLAIGGWWVGLFAWIARRAPLVPLHDPRLEGIFDAERALQHA